jgi:hypothetical protein
LKAAAVPCDSSQYTCAADVAVFVSQYKGDVVEDVVAGEVAGRLSLEKGVRDLLVAVRVVIPHPGRETER